MSGASAILAFLALAWIITMIIMVINTDTIKDKEGTGAMFGLSLFMCVFSAYSVFIYVWDMVLITRGLGVDFEAPIPFHLRLVLYAFCLLLIVYCSWSIYKYHKDYKDDDSIPQWKKNIFLWGNAVMLMVAGLSLLGKHTQIAAEHIEPRVKSAVSGLLADKKEATGHKLPPSLNTTKEEVPTSPQVLYHPTGEKVQTQPADIEMQPMGKQGFRFKFY